MIIGIGIDFTEIQRMEEGLAQEAFLRRVFTPAELASVQQYRNKAEHLAGKFAAKEAFMKALGAGIGQEVWFTQIEVLNEGTGKPYVEVRGEAAQLLETSGSNHIHVSISHSGGLAVAVVVLEG